ncbi:hypothetical protein WZ78_09530 [Leuconostoc mesenteroides subsp. dextranicum]|jgi:hypothetical protein|uniref:hypothetical protein n=1 Tax=Leuconostoc mesenteroides TaxID=1245 RepID=UPI0006823074|nr:hypothetical protein [Leuconostoc mesenteroides]KMY80382.1 hypothetical protein WZ78_09530 [Leuconostoc mesenteroides subsp. dextranicum]MBZ1503361.1 hypothetical protein [Leuconostoc mesenteroides]MCM6827882.1 hypothetical protein [Leuconostoc mesenteroides]MCT3048032.1 hypothetical protein [Leuconostoc mesenteroides]RDF87511.1 hypothetical protein DQM10_09670 [Leuconostoc mesenteroides subsp. mesenteroides]
MSKKLNQLVSSKDKLQKKIDQEEFILRQSKYFENSKARKERTRLLIQKGALLDKYFETESLSVDDTESLLKIFSNYVNSNKPDKYKKDNPKL